MVEARPITPPRIKEGPREYDVGLQGSNITLKCEAEGHPVPVITWTRDSQPVLEDGRLHVDSQTGDLTVTQATKEDDGRSVNIALSALPSSARLSIEFQSKIG